MSEAEGERRELEDLAKYIILELEKPTKKPNAFKPSKGKDLSQHKDSLISLLEDVADCFQVAKDDFDSRADPNKPKRNLEEKTISDNSTFDYGVSAGVGLEGWDKFWEQTYGRNARNPGYNRRKSSRSEGKGFPPVTPLHSVYYEICNWWLNIAKLGPFNPSFSYESQLPYQFEYCNSSARILILIAQWLDDGYSLSNAASVHDHMRRYKPPKI